MLVGRLVEWDDLEETLTLGKRPGSVQNGQEEMTNRGAKEGDPSGLQVRVTKKGDHQLCLLANLLVGGRSNLGVWKFPRQGISKKWGF